MNKLQKSMLLILGMLCPVLASCVDSDNPLSDPKQATVDRGLLGVWREQTKDNEVSYYHVGLAGEKFPAGMLRVKIIKHNENGELPRPDNDDLLVFATTLENNHYLNLTILAPDKIKTMGESPWKPSLAEAYFLYKYELQGDTLGIACMDPEQKEEAIKTGKIKGTIEGDKVRITDTMENLARFVAAAGPKKLFFSKDALGEGYGILERVK